VNLDDRIARLERGVDALLHRLTGLPSEALYQSPKEGEWPVMSNLAHVAEMLPYWAHQAEHIAQHPGAPFGRTVDDPGRLDGVEQHARDAVDVIGPALRAALTETVRTLRSIPDAGWDLSGVHQVRGAMTATQVLDTLMVEHTEDHVAQIDAALSALGYSPSQVP
jgi:uncharacterized damage-inducible protein DinB